MHDGRCASPRGHDDMHMPSWGDDWDSRTNDEIVGECCHHHWITHNCWSFMEERMMHHCENGGERRGHDDWHMPWWGDPGHPDWTGDDWYSRSREEIEDECCLNAHHDDEMSTEQTVATGALAFLATKDLLGWVLGGAEHGI